MSTPRTQVRRVAWFDEDGEPLAYLLSVGLWLPLSALPLILSVEGHGGWALLALAGALAAHFTPYDMVMSALVTQDRSVFSWWALKAHLWLLAGGAAAQAVRERRARAST